MAIDIGDKWLGVALSDPLRITATPWSSIRCENEEEIISTVCEFAKTNKIAMLVAGLPRSMDGSSGQQEKKVRQMVENIAGKVGVPVVYQDERLSTSQARDILESKKAKPGTRDDALAAAIILQEYLNANCKPGGPY